MATYTVTITDKEIYIIEGVVAESEDEATDIAYEMLEANRHMYHTDSDGECEVVEDDE